MQIDWMFLTYLVAGFTTVLGFLRGWWKEAITTFILAVLLILLQQPDWAGAIINLINSLIVQVWQFLPDLPLLALPSQPFQIDPTGGGTWVIILILLLGVSALISRATLPAFTKRVPGQYYSVGLIGRVLGLALGGLNGFLILGLVREYLDGRALPGRAAPADTAGITIVSSSAFGPAANNVSIQAVNMPNFTVLDSYIPWFIIGIGLLIFFAAIKSRVKIESSPAGKRIVYSPPFGHQAVKVEKPRRRSPLEELLEGG
jgi:hypothetical protein